MKIEKINDHQIRCTLTRSDLAERHIDLSELAYGNEKTRNLFREMMEQASEEVGFEAEDIPLMVEAMPVSSDCLVLIITKVDNPDELDPRFARFAPMNQSEDEAPQLQAPVAPPATLEETTAEEAAACAGVARIFRFSSLDSICDAATILKDTYFGVNSLYKDPEYHDYYLLVSKSGHTPTEFNRACNILSEYGSRISSDLGVEGFLDERFDRIVGDKALQSLALVND